MRIPNGYPIKDLHPSFSHDKEVFETKTAEALQGFGAVKFAIIIIVMTSEREYQWAAQIKWKICWKILITNCKAKSTILRTTALAER